MNRIFLQLIPHLLPENELKKKFFLTFTGLMDIALITANANQLRYLLEFNRKSDTFHIIIGLIIVSLILQVIVAMFLIFKSRYSFKGKSKCSRAKLIKNCVTFCVFLISIVNIFIVSFTTMAHD